ncbi:MAG: filamentous hemagglutinin N-terminal domain-containing protein [Aquabacterium sp.]|uniref:beta strand repeat-containing protein n=1 Tax=Aquabacterium sp. TaxID=1872578 RepID=UPI0025B98893|nr:filamentous hemagglutinin N-terminal domain-containing protein [Aquabacterium sp.]MBI3380517.1 filamentous hemagglutinin N-terminal domain-containing protein [Aquabacterium sp.]
MQTLSSSKRHSRALVRLRPLMIALCAAGYASATLAVLPSRTIDAQTVPEVGNTYGGITSNVSTSANGAVTLTINQSTATGVVEVSRSTANGQYQISGLSVGRNASVEVFAPTASSLTVLRSLGQDPSYIYGRITANDRLFVINPNGIYVGATGSVSAASLVMSALDLSSDYVANNYAKLFADTHVVFTAGASGYGYGSYGSPVVEIEKGATLTATDGGGVMLIGDRGVRNAGGISVGSGGDITLVAGATVEANIGDSGYIKLSTVADASVPGQVTDFTGRSVVNTGTLDAPNGTVTLQTKGDGFGGNVFGDPTRLSGLVTEGSLAGVFNAGTIRANGVNGGQGTVKLIAEGPDAAAMNSGTIDVSAKDARSLAGSILMSASTVMVGNRDGGSAQLLAEGPLGGGTITLNNATVTGSESSSLIRVESSSTLSADATDNGSGGRITLSSFDGLTEAQLSNDANIGTVRVYGTLQARGGVNGGNGGTVDTVGTYVNVQDVNLGRASILVGARAAGAVGGVWSVYAPGLTIGANVPSVSQGSNQSETYITDTDINAVLNSGGNVAISTSFKALAADTKATVNLSGGVLTVASGTQIQQSEGLGGNRLHLQSAGDLTVEGGVTVASTAGPLNVSLMADSYGTGKGSVILDGASRSVDTRQGLEVAPEGGIVIQTNGGNLNLIGATNPAVAGTASVNGNPGVSINGTVISTVGSAGRGDVLVKGSGGVAGDSVSLDTTVASQIGVAIGGGTTIDAGNVTILGNSTSVAGVSLANTTISTDKGVIDIRGVSEGGRTVPFREQPIGVDIGAGVTLNAGQGSVRILGRGVREAGATLTGLADTYGVRANDLLVTTSGVNPGQQITIVGQSVGSAGAGIQVDAGQPGIQVYDQASTSGALIASNADIVMGASADAAAPQALNLGTPTFNTNGRLNFRPAGVSADGNLTEATATAIRVGTVAGAIPTNFIVQPGWFNAAVNPGVSAGVTTVIGSNVHSGQISVEDGALNGAGKVTLQNQNEQASASASGSGSGNKTAAAAAPAPGGIDLGAQTGANPALNLTLATAGDITQSGPINVASLQVIGAPGSKVQLNNPGNQISSAIFNNGVLAPQINAQSLPQSTTTATAMGYSVNTGDTASNAFVPLAINFTTNRNEGPYLPPEDRPKLPFESVDALNELRTDVYLHGQFSRPQLCTPANTLAAATAGAGGADPLSLEWTKVRRGAQLSNCSGVQADGNCSAF